MVNISQNTVDKAVTVINKFNDKKCLINTSKLAIEAGISGKRLKELKRRLVEFSIADFIKFKDAEFWFPVREFSSKGRDVLEQQVAVMYFNEQKEKDKETRELKQAIRKEFLKSRQFSFAEPIVKCDCGKELSRLICYETGSITCKKMGVDSFAGSIHCPKCNKQIYFGFLYQGYGKDLIQDGILLEAHEKLGVNLRESIPLKINDFFTNIWNASGKNGGFKFK